MKQKLIFWKNKVVRYKIHSRFEYVSSYITYLLISTHIDIL